MTLIILQDIFIMYYQWVPFLEYLLGFIIGLEKFLVVNIPRFRSATVDSANSSISVADEATHQVLGKACIC